MKARRKAATAVRLLSSRLLGARRPLAVCWHVTHRCNASCRYCGIPSDVQEELSTVDALAVIEGLRGLGTAAISFCGGEPLVREDLGKLIGRCRELDMDVILISNGALVPQRLDDVRQANVLKLSLDGPAAVHDELRGRGSFDKTMAAADSAKGAGINVAFNTTLCGLNIPHIRDILALGASRGIPVRFSPIKRTHARGKDIAGLLPSRATFRGAVDLLLRERRAGAPILNSYPALRYLAAFPDGSRLDPCVAGRIFFNLAPNGDVHPCEAVQRGSPLNCRRDGVRQAIEGTPPASCSACWCAGTLELNMLFRLRSLAALARAAAGP